MVQAGVFPVKLFHIWRAQGSSRQCKEHVVQVHVEFIKFEESHYTYFEIFESYFSCAKGRTTDPELMMRGGEVA